MKKILLAALATVAAVAPAQAAITFTTVQGSNTVFNDSAVGAITFNGLGVGSSYGGTGVISSGTSGTSAQPAFSDGSRYLTVSNGNSAIVGSGGSFDTVSLYWGSIDGFNTIELLGAGNSVLASFTGTQIVAPDAANGNQPLPVTNRLVTFSGNGQQFTGIRLVSTGNSFEADNVRFSNAVPEPATWGMMLVGFGAVGSAMRRRRVMKPSFV